MAGWTPQGMPSAWELLKKGSRKAMRIVCLSDTHGRGQINVPSGDVLIHAGDLTGRGTLPQVQTELQWLASLPFKHRLVIAGNHDFLFQRDPGLARSVIPPGITYLQDSGVEIDGFKFWGSPWQPEFYDWAFNLPRGEPLKEKWTLIPDDTDVVITHGPARKHLDFVQGGSHVGCSDLERRLKVVKPLLHVCGHVHEANGSMTEDGITYINAAICDRDDYEPIQRAWALDLYEDDGKKKVQIVW